MKRMILWGLAFSLAAAPALSRDRRDGDGHGNANPSAVVAAEVAFAQLAQEKGQWTAFRTTATKDAVMFVPQMAYAQAWLKDRPDPAKAVTWQPHQVWMSCDGTLAVTRGAWQGPNSTSGYFTTVWQRQKDGKYKWVLDQGEELPMPLDPPDMIVGKVADCPPGYRPGRGPRPKDFKGNLPPLDPARRSGQSLDGTLGWDVTVSPEGARRFTVTMQLEGARATVQDLQVEAPAKK
ncbi:MAG TPA: hypothetical protein VFV30_02890 [Novosphingobium sp.]|nr:hypothetical protein [Novosphingobium sp.]